MNNFRINIEISRISKLFMSIFGYILAFLLIVYLIFRFVQFGGSFSLLSTNGDIISDQSLKGRPFAIFFGFTHCPDVCPTTLAGISQDLEAIDKISQKAKDIKVYFVSVDPERDNVTTLKDYISSFGDRIIGLIPKDEAELKDIAKKFRVYYRKIPSKYGYSMDHTTSIYLMDRRGEFFDIIDMKEKPEIRQKKLLKMLDLEAF